MKKTTIISILFLLAACDVANAPTTATENAALIGSVDCANPVDYGAVPDDGIDDGPAFRSMMTAPGVQHACVGPGHWTLNYNRTSSITLTQGQTLVGAGPSTVFDMTGDGHAGSWNGIELDGGSSTGFSINQVGITNPDPGGQTHMIQVGAGEGTRITDVVMGPSASGLGDCIRFLGTDSTHQVVGTIVSHVVALQCGRDALSWQHDVASITVTASVLNSIGDGEIDNEPTSVGPVTETITGNVMLHSAGNTSEAVTLSDSNGGNNTVFADNLVIGGNMQAVRATNASISHNTILGSPTANTPTIDIIRDSSGVRLDGNLIVRPAGAPALYAVRFIQNNGGTPTNETIANNRIVQGTASYAVYLEGVGHTGVSDNNITMAVPWSNGYAIGCRSVVGSCDLNKIEGNIIDSPAGTTYGAIIVSSGVGMTIGRVLVLGNMGSGFTYSVVCSGTYVGPVRIDDNMLGGTVVCTGASIGVNL